MKYIYLLILIPVLFLESCDGFNSTRKEGQQTGNQWTINESGDSVYWRYTDNGKLKSFTTYVNGKRNGRAEKYYDNRQLNYRINYKEGYKHGEVIWYHPNGNVYRTSTYENGFIEGIQKKYYESGGLMAEIPYEAGEIMPGTKEYTKDGKLKKQIPVLQYKTIDKLAFENKYVVQLNLTNNSKAVNYFRFYKSGEQLRFGKNKINSKNGVGEVVYDLKKGQYIMEKLYVRAEYKSSLGVIHVFEKTINVAADNKN